MGSQQFCLRWNNHQTNMLSVFDKLLIKESFVDVTIACEGLSIKAHKIVLSACSPFFEELFCENPCKHPIVILKDMKHSDLKAVIEFMYKGEINVSQDRLSGLLKTAECLKVKGLAEVAQDEQNGGKISDYGGRPSSDHSPISAPQTPIVNHVSSTSNKRKSKTPKSSSEYHNDSISHQPVPKKRAESPKSVKSSPPTSCDTSENMPSSAEIQSTSIPTLTSPTISSQPIHLTQVQTPHPLPSNLPVFPSKDGLKMEPSPGPDIISSDPLIHLETDSNEEYILEPETGFDHDTKNNDSTEFQDNEYSEHQNIGPDSSFLMDPTRDPGPSQDMSTVIYPDNTKTVQSNAVGSYQFRTRHVKRWSEEDMRQAIAMITAGGWDIRRTAETYNIPLRTLYYHLKKARKDKTSPIHTTERFFIKPYV